MPIATAGEEEVEDEEKNPPPKIAFTANWVIRKMPTPCTRFCHID